MSESPTLMKAATPIALVLGLIAGFAGKSLLSGSSADSASKESTDTSPQPAGPTLELVQLREKNSKLKARLAELEKPTGTDEIAETSPKSPTVVKIGGNNGKMEFDLAALMEQSQKQQQKRNAKKNELKLATLTAKLDLTEEQQTALRALLEKRSNQQGDMLSKAISFASKDGGTGSVEIDATDLADLDPTTAQKQYEEDLMALLSDDQKAAYAEYQAERRANQIEVQANRELASLQSRFDLTEDQKNSAFDAFTELAATDVDAQAETGNRFGNFQKQRQQRQEAMADVLTPEQMEVYQQSPQGGLLYSSGLPDGAEAAVFSTIDLGGASGAVFGTSVESSITIEAAPAE